MADSQAVASLPTGDPVPAPPTGAKAKAPAIPLSTILAAVPGNVDAFIAHLHRCMQTPAGIDTVLLLVGYSARLSANILDAASRAAIESSAHKLIALAFSLPPNTTFLLSSAPRAAPFAALAIKLAARLRALSTLLSESRTFLRSWALLGMYLWGKSLIPLLRGPKPTTNGASNEKNTATAPQTAAESLDRAIVLTQFVAITLFQVTENAWFLSSKGVFGLSPEQIGRTAKFSTRCWMTFVGLEIGRLLVERHRKTATASATDLQSAEHVAWKNTWRRALVKNMSWAPVTVHYSFGTSMPDTAIAICGFIPGIIGITQLWKDTAK